MSGARVFPVTLPGVWEALASLGPGSSGRRLPLNSVLCSAALYAPPECGTWIRARGTFFSRFGDPACSGSIVFKELIFSAHPLPPPFAPAPARGATSPAPQGARPEPHEPNPPDVPPMCHSRAARPCLQRSPPTRRATVGSPDRLLGASTRSHPLQQYNDEAPQNLAHPTEAYLLPSAPSSVCAGPAAGFRLGTLFGTVTCDYRG